MKQIYFLSKCLTILLALGVSTSWSQIIDFNYTGEAQTYVVPPGVSSIRVEAYGAEGYGNLGYGGFVRADLTVTGGEILQINVGGMGGSTYGGFNGGGVPGVNATYGGGGGASDIRSGGVDFANRIIVAGGGGGSGSNCGTWTAEGGHGGGLIGMSACVFSCSDCQYTGAGGTQVAGGIAGPTGHGSCGGNTNGSLGLGGNNTGAYGTGGGGGYYGGGSGCFEGAGGGSSYTHPDAIDVVHEQGVRTGDGFISIEILCSGLTLVATPTGVCAGESVTLTGTSETGGIVTWDGGIENGESFVPPLGETIYTAVSTSPEDCNLEVIVTSTEVPVLIPNSSSPAAC
ncbi:glycine-rich protein, partial [Crocinitomix catalasitica]|uniref:glycine-rich protein n=1 Tax=Crocinitomix catalasitica TaxID=184607 RepID=UPI001FDF46B6